MALPGQLKPAWLARDEACRMAGDFVERRCQGLSERWAERAMGWRNGVV
jgi:hypothetical protein